MAIRYAVASGNWSSTATWNGGTLPASGDDVYSNGFTVSIDQTITVKSLKRLANASPVIVAGGAFNVTASISITVTDGINGDDHAANSTALINVSAGTPSVTINANITGGSTGSSRRGVTVSVSANVTINGNVAGGAGGQGLHLTNASPTITVNGNVTGGTGTGGPGINDAATLSLITVNGNVTGGVGLPGISVQGKLRVDGQIRFGSTGYAPILSNNYPPMFVRGDNLAFIVRSADDWPNTTGADITLLEDGGGAAGRYTLAVGDSAVTAG